MMVIVMVSTKQCCGNVSFRFISYFVSRFLNLILIYVILIFFQDNICCLFLLFKNASIQYLLLQPSSTSSISSPTPRPLFTRLPLLIYPFFLLISFASFWLSSCGPWTMLSDREGLFDRYHSQKIIHYKIMSIDCWSSLSYYPILFQK